VKNQVNQWNMQNNYHIDIFDYEGHDPWHTLYFFTFYKMEKHFSNDSIGSNYNPFLKDLFFKISERGKSCKMIKMKREIGEQEK